MAGPEDNSAAGYDFGGSDSGTDLGVAGMIIESSCERGSYE